MGYLVITNTFSNGATSDATAVNTNFTDVVNATSDGTKNFNISALTCAGSATFNAAVTLGLSIANDITFTGSLASSIPIKTTYSYDIGTASIGLKSIYLGDAGSAARSTRVIGATVPSSWTLTLPTTAGNAGDVLVNNGSGVSTWLMLDEVNNLGLTATVSANALTITIKDSAGAAPSAASPVYITFRNVTATTGTPVRRALTSATAGATITVPSSATLGHAAGVNQYVWIYALDNAGTIELAVGGAGVFDDRSIQSSTLIDGTATSATVLYSTTARSAVPCKIIGRLTIQESVAGTWATAPTQIVLNPVPAAAVTDWVKYTPTHAGFGTVASVNVWSRRVGDSLQLRGSWTNGTVSSTTAQMSLGFNGVNSGLTSDSTKVATTQIIGLGGRSSSGGVSVPSILNNGGNAYVNFSLMANASYSGSTPQS